MASCKSLSGHVAGLHSQGSDWRLRNPAVRVLVEREAAGVRDQAMRLKKMRAVGAIAILVIALLGETCESQRNTTMTIVLESNP